ncbi:MAG TPA: UDP-N-acetylmuramate dehydrogenase, partial [Candidatus Saccharimonadales bacterium]|nr:UDP-N-acetylmuramate dehydrogenase [Candidatus Saccharimonadales bacterium]
MDIIENASLTDYSTMGLGGKAAYVTEVNTPGDVVEALRWANERKLPALIIGGGSNIVWSDDGFDGLLLIDKIPGYEISEEDEHVTLRLGSGEPWDSVVERSVSAGLTGIEALSLVPGSTGATPIQNVGAYGQEIAQTLVEVEAYDTQAAKFVTLAAAECGFTYRDSRFKTGPDRGRFFITGITLKLRKGDPEPPFYGVLQTYLEEHEITEYTPAVIREAVIAIRSSKLPDPAVIRNTGSFFANPIVSEEVFLNLSDKFPDVPNWMTAHGIKLSAAWLIVQAGFKDFHDSETG